MTERRTGIQGDRAVTLSTEDGGDPREVSRGANGEIGGTGELKNLDSGDILKDVVADGILGKQKRVNSATPDECVGDLRVEKEGDIPFGEENGSGCRSIEIVSGATVGTVVDVLVTASANNCCETDAIGRSTEGDRGSRSQLKNLDTGGKRQGAVGEIRRTVDAERVVEITTDQGICELILIGKGEGDASGGFRAVNNIGVGGLRGLTEGLSGSCGDDRHHAGVVQVSSGDKRGGGGKLYG